jgi:hypothetical protein
MIFQRFHENAMHQMVRTLRVPVGKFNIPRTELSQIKDQPHFLDWLTDQGIPFSVDVGSPSTVQPIQTDLSHNKILGMMQSDDEKIHAPFIISSDGYILDGHHRWASILNKTPYYRCTFRRVSLPMEKLLPMARKYPRVSYENV